jgi:hypothetical protein
MYSTELNDRPTATVTLEGRAPLLGYAARDRADLLNAMRFFTHTWGGNMAVLLPCPTNDDELTAFKLALERADPDVLLIGGETLAEIDPQIGAGLQDLAQPLYAISPDQMRQHETVMRFRLRSAGELAHPASVLSSERPDGTRNSNVRLCRAEGAFAETLRLVAGETSATYSDWLVEAHSAQWLRAPVDLSELVNIEFVLRGKLTLRDLAGYRTHANATSSVDSAFLSPLSGMLESEESVHLFLDDGTDLSVPMAHWNSSRASRALKLLLPLDAFTRDPRGVLDAVRASTSINDVLCVAHVSRERAEKLHASIVAVVDGKPVRVIYGDGFVYHVSRIRGAYGTPQSATLAIGAKRTLRFVAPPPVHAAADVAFAFDAEISIEGTKLSLPRTRISSLLLGNELWRLDRWARNEGGVGNGWLTGSAVRARPEGAAGVTKLGGEVTLHLHTAEDVIRYHLHPRGIQLRQNPNTRFALGVQRRFGGLSDTLALVRDGGSLLMKALRSEEPPPGFKRSAIVQRLQSDFGLTADKAKGTVASLDRLAGAGLVRRGLWLRCSECDLEDWYSVDELREWMECSGCGVRFQLSTSGRGTDWVYRPNELAQRFLDAGGHAVLTTAAMLDQLGGGHLIQLGGCLHRGDADAPFAEADVLDISESGLWLVECKDYDDLTVAKYLGQVAASVDRLLSAAKEVGAVVVLLGITSRNSDQRLFELVQQRVATARTDQIGVHLFLNEGLHPDGEMNPVDMRGLSRNQLSLRPALAQMEIVGAFPSGTAFGGWSVAPSTRIDALDKSLREIPSQRAPTEDAG